MIELPLSCVVNKYIPKKTFYEKVNIPNSIKEEFAQKLSKIYWKYKISEETINISKTEEIEEIEVFELELKEKYNCKNIIKVITKNIPYPILFYITYEDEFQYAIKYNEDIFFSNWNELVTFCFSTLNLKILYDNLVKAVSNIDETVKDLDNEIQKKNRIHKLEEEIKRLEIKIRSEKQFNIKVELNKKMLNYRSELEKINEHKI